MADWRERLRKRRKERGGPQVKAGYLSPACGRNNHIACRLHEVNTRGEEMPECTCGCHWVQL